MISVMFWFVDAVQSFHFTVPASLRSSSRSPVPIPMIRLTAFPKTGCVMVTWTVTMDMMNLPPLANQVSS